MNEMTTEPRRHYDLAQPIPRHHLFGSGARIVERHGRAGLNTTSIRGRLALPEHTINAPRGTLCLWMMPLDDLHPAQRLPQHAQSNPHYDRFVLLSDREAVHDFEAARFSLMYWTNWHPVFAAKFVEGGWSDMYWGKRGAVAAAGHLHLPRLLWHHIAVTWDREESDYRLYLNGILVGAHDTTEPQPLRHEPCAPVLYLGNPALAFSTVTFYDRLLPQQELRRIFSAEATHVDEEFQSELEKTYEGRDLPPFSFTPDESWNKRLDLSLSDPDHFLHFFYQGGPATQFTDEGLRITTPSMQECLARRRKKGDETIDMARMYLWTRRMFEGDLHVSLEFQLRAHGGLCLLMTQAAGMQREDFLADYFLRSNGAMRCVCWEDIRNYHWEFYREMTDVRNDLVSHACLKNPWYRPMSFQIEPRRWELDRWYRLEYLQEGARIRGAIDGVTVMDVTDNPTDNNGPILLNGHVAIRCMMRTDLLLRNLQIHDRPAITSREAAVT
jgi:hypothetical protein